MSIEHKRHRFIKKYAKDKNSEETVVMDKNDPSFKNSKTDQIQGVIYDWIKIEVTTINFDYFACISA